MIDFNLLKFGKNGLIPAIVTDFYSKKTLTLAYMNEESLRVSIAEKRTCFYSRSRKCLWRKGETSGNVQHIVSISADCDYDALLVEVIKDGPACHTGADSCFFNELYADSDIENAQFSFDKLYKLLSQRYVERPQNSYTSYLFNEGIDKILKKVGEECTEVVVAGKGGDKAETIYEIADLAYHVMVLMIQMQITPDDVKCELNKRHVIDHKIKQKKMQ